MTASARTKTQMLCKQLSCQDCINNSSGKENINMSKLMQSREQSHALHVQKPVNPLCVARDNEADTWQDEL